MDDNKARIDEFTAEIHSMKLKAGGAESEARLLLVGVLLAVAGLALAIYGGIMVQSDSNEFNQRSFMATGSFLGLALIISGAALFIRFSLARYMRFWMIRLLHDSRANTDRLVAAIESAAGDRESSQ